MQCVKILILRIPTETIISTVVFSTFHSRHTTAAHACSFLWRGFLQFFGRIELERYMTEEYLYLAPRLYIRERSSFRDLEVKLMGTPFRWVLEATLEFYVLPIPGNFNPIPSCSNQWNPPQEATTAWAQETGTPGQFPMFKSSPLSLDFFVDFHHPPILLNAIERSKPKVIGFSV